MSPPRLPHANLDLASRQKKALKIERLLGLAPSQQPLRLLEIGTGSGGIAHYFATHPHLRCEVVSVDVTDQRQVTDGYTFIQVSDVALPFEENTFDVVLSNHVIEHVGDRRRQLHHLGEIHRVLKQRGIGYLALPNRWMLVEPHYRLVFLSWLPTPLRSRYLRLLQRGEFYDCSPLSLGEVETILRASGLRHEYLGTRAFREFMALEGGRSLVLSLIAAVPDAMLDLFAPINPTLAFRVWK